LYYDCPRSDVHEMSDSMPGTLIGAMLLGIVESFTATVYGPSWAPPVSFGLLLLTLAVRPAGLMGR
jgi:branched-chain amino acid transport system permease protein